MESKAKKLDSARSFEDLKQIFSYDRNLPLDIRDTGSEDKDGVYIHDISYLSQADRRVNAYLALPSGTGPFAGIVFLHPGPGSRSTFLDEAVDLAGIGAASLLIDAPWSDIAGFVKRVTAGPEAVRDMFIQTAIDLRRGLDLLATRADVNLSRIGYVGHSFGALFGGLLSGVEKRTKAYVLMAGTGSFTDVAVLNMPGLQGQELERYRLTMDPIDPIHYIGHAAPSKLFFQFGLRDRFFPRQNIMDYYQAASEPKQIKWYEADHYSLNEKGRHDRKEWLRAELAF
jgi:uncharacterized protein